MIKSKLEQQIIDVLEPLAQKQGIDVVDVELVGATKAPCVRVRLERADGSSLTLDEVSAQNAWVSDALDSLDPIAGPYTLEVSSPGMARPLRRPQDFQRFLGSEVDVSATAASVRRRARGVLSACDAQGITIALSDDESLVFPYDHIQKCVLRPVYDFKSGKGDE